MKKAMVFILTLFVMAAMIPQMALSAYAAESSDYVNITKHDNFTKNGKVYMSFTIENMQKGAYVGELFLGEQLLVNASLINSSGKQVKYWDTLALPVEEKKTWDFGIDFSELPSGTYTFRLKIKAILAETSWKWDYSIKHTAPAASVSYQSYETYYSDSGKYMHKINIQCKNMKGKKLYCKIYDEYGNLMLDWGTDTATRKSNNEVGFFAWSGYSEGVKQPSGNYTFVISNSANKKIIEKTLYLNIREAGNG